MSNVTTINFTDPDWCKCKICDTDILKQDAVFVHITELSANDYVCKPCMKKVNTIKINDHMPMGDVVLG